MTMITGKIVELADSKESGKNAKNKCAISSFEPYKSPWQMATVCNPRRKRGFRIHT